MIQLDPATMKILVVDDRKEALAASHRVLCRAGYQVFEAATGEEGVRMVHELRPDLVLMDVRLPGISGLEAVRIIKADPDLAAIFVAIMSASEISSEQQAGGLEVGADGYIVRPIPNQELLARVNAFLRLKKTADALRASQELFSHSFEYASIGMALITPDGRWLKVNQALCELVGYSEAELLTHTFQDITHPEDLEADIEKRRRLMAGEIRSYQSEKRLFHLQGHIIIILLNVSLVRNAEGGELYLIAQFQDITERKRAEQKAEKALKKELVLRREIHHRVKNNLQIIISLLYLQSTTVHNPTTLALLQESQARVRSIALVHEMLYQREDLTNIAFGDYVRQLAADLFQAYQVTPGSIDLKVVSEGIIFGIETAIPCGIIITELITNSLKYAFPGGRKGEIEIDLRCAEESRTLSLSVRDNGVGLPKDFDLKSIKTMGLSLVRDLTRQLGGKVEFRKGSCGHGTLATITFLEPISTGDVVSLDNLNQPQGNTDLES